jgi:hypothetical protein
MAWIWDSAMGRVQIVEWPGHLASRGKVIVYIGTIDMQVLLQFASLKPKLSSAGESLIAC